MMPQGDAARGTLHPTHAGAVDLTGSFLKDTNTVPCSHHGAATRVPCICPGNITQLHRSCLSTSTRIPHTRHAAANLGAAAGFNTATTPRPRSATTTTRLSPKADPTQWLEAESLPHPSIAPYPLDAAQQIPNVAPYTLQRSAPNTSLQPLVKEPQTIVNSSLRPAPSRQRRVLRSASHHCNRLLCSRSSLALGFRGRIGEL